MAYRMNKHCAIGWLKWLSAVLFAIATLAVGSPAEARHHSGPREGPFTYGAPAFCAPEEPVEDFGLSELPPVREAPATGDLPFGPRTVSLQLWSGPIFQPGQSVGFWLHSLNYRGRTPLRWALRNRLRTVDSAGQTGPVLARGRTRVRMISARKEVKLFLDLPRDTGFYRYEIEIVDFEGKRLALYGSNVRVERKFWDARLGLNGDEFRPGDTVLNRLENFGTEAIAYGEEFRIQAYRGGQWVPVRNPSQEGWLLWLGYLNPGWAGECGALGLPDDFPAGEYRIVKEVGTSSWPQDGQSYWLTASFSVVKPGP